MASAPTLNHTDSYVLTPAAAAVFTAPNPDSSESPGWNFHDTYFVTVKAAKPNSATVGSSDAALRRAGLVTARTRILPDL